MTGVWFGTDWTHRTAGSRSNPSARTFHHAQSFHAPEPVPERHTQHTSTRDMVATTRTRRILTSNIRKASRSSWKRAMIAYATSSSGCWPPARSRTRNACETKAKCIKTVRPDRLYCTLYARSFASLRVDRVVHSWGASGVEEAHAFLRRFGAPRYKRADLQNTRDFRALPTLSDIAFQSSRERCTKTWPSVGPVWNSTLERRVRVVRRCTAWRAPSTISAVRETSFCHNKRSSKRWTIACCYLSVFSSEGGNGSVLRRSPGAVERIRYRVYT